MTSCLVKARWILQNASENRPTFMKISYIGCNKMIVSKLIKYDKDYLDYDKNKL